MSKRTTANLIRHKIRLVNNRIDLQIIQGQTNSPAFKKNMAEHKVLFNSLKKLTA